MTSGPTRDLGKSMFRSMLRVRRVEERIRDLYPEQDMRCPTHFSIGQEAVASGVCALLEKPDKIISAHRSHAHYLCAGGDLKKMFAELYGKQTGCAGGKGGSMHLIDTDVNFLGCVPIVGSTIAIGVGSALAGRIDRKGPEAGLSLVFFGDGAVETGIFHESVNYATTCRLPVVFVCENNLYSVMTPLEERQPASRAIVDLAAGHGLPVAHADGQDCDLVYETAAPLFEAARRGEGPVFLEFATYRWLEHCGPLEDLHFGFRPEGEFEAWAKRCPIEIAKSKNLAAGVITEAELEALDDAIGREIDEAVAFAKSSTFPERNTLLEGVYA